MHRLLWLIVGLPFLSSLILAIFGARIPKRLAGVIGVGSVAASWIFSMVASIIYLSRVYPAPADTILYRWMSVGGLDVEFGLRLDALSLVMVGVVALVGFLIHLYSFESMYDDDGYTRFFSYMNLFVGSMLVLVLASDLLPLYLGWEGVGLCSYLLIGFWYKERANGHAAQKAFIITRIGDAAFAVALFLLFREYGTLDLPIILAATPAAIPSAMAIWIAALLLAGAVGKSAQIPLQAWLPDAMAGPTPVSALLHAATMVTAGMYLIARMHTFFIAAPPVQFAVAVIGTATLLYAALSALVQKDIKRVLAYSSMSQIGYMFLALGVGAWTAAVFHFVTHAFFKALLFLSAGVVIDALHEEHDILKMGGLRRQLPTAFWTFLIGAASLAALPLVTAGFYSKDAILWSVWSSRLGGIWLWLMAMTGAFITAIYIFRLVFLVFLGQNTHEISKHPRPLMRISLWVLAAFSIVAGFVWTPDVLGNYQLFPALEHVVLPAEHYTARATHTIEIELLIISSLLSILGVYVAYLYWRRARWTRFAEQHPQVGVLNTFLFSGCEYDKMCDVLFVRPFRAVTMAGQSDVVDKPFTWLARAVAYFNRLLSDTQTGRLRDYAVGLALGAVIIAAVVLLR